MELHHLASCNGVARPPRDDRLVFAQGLSDGYVYFTRFLYCFRNPLDRPAADVVTFYPVPRPGPAGRTHLLARVDGFMSPDGSGELVGEVELSSQEFPLHILGPTPLYTSDSFSRRAVAWGTLWLVLKVVTYGDLEHEVARVPVAHDFFSSLRPETFRVRAYPLASSFQRVALELWHESEFRSATLTIHSVRLHGAEGQDELHRRLDRLQAPAEYLRKLLDVRRLLHAQYVAGMAGVRCVTYRAVESMKQQAELAANTFFVTYADWGRSTAERASFDSAESLLLEAQSRGALPADADVWQWLHDNQAGVNGECQTVRAPLEPDEQHLSGVSPMDVALAQDNIAAFRAETIKYQEWLDLAQTIAARLQVQPSWLQTLLRDP